MLHERVEHAHDCRHAAHQRDQRTPPPGWRAEQVEHDTHEPVDRHLGHDAAHQRRDVARSGGMRKRQPDMQGHDPGFGAGADQRERENGACDSRRRHRAADALERVAARGAGEQAEGKQQRERAETCHEQVQIAGSGIAGPAMVRHHQRPGRKRHELPGKQERERVVGEHDEVHPGEECRKERQHAPGRFLVAAISKPV